MAQMAQAIAGLFPGGVGVSAVAIGSAPHPWPKEASAVAHAVPHRQAEFAAGRMAARNAMRDAGIQPSAIPMGDDRAPVWPLGVIGSITHSSEFALAVVAQDQRFQGIGLDAEPDQPLPYDVLSAICDSDECGWVAGQAQPLRWARLIFAAKEAAYKCQYPLSKALFGFDAMTVEVDPENRLLSARFTRAIEPFAAGRVLQGRYVLTEGLVIAGFAIETD